MCRLYWGATILTVFELARRSMRQNVKHYYLYFFALIFCTSLFFVFTSLLHDQQVNTMVDSSVNYKTAFQIATILLLIIIGIFTVSSNQIFLRRRSREMGLYQLIGLSKGWVARYLIIENVLLGFGALVAGILAGAFISRLFVLMLMNLLHLDGIPAISFSFDALLDTTIVSILIIFITSIQILSLTYRSTLLQLFQADKQPELNNKRPSFISAVAAVLGILLIVYGYQLSGRMVNEQLLLNIVLVLISTILGTYLLFRVTVRWTFTLIRRNKNGYLSLSDSLSLASLMHRMKANANTLTIITVLSALTITLVTISYSIYYSAEKETRMELPYDFTFEDSQTDAELYKSILDREGISYSANTFETFRSVGFVLNPQDEHYRLESNLLWLSAEQLNKAGQNVPIPLPGEVVEYDAWASSNYDDIDLSKRYPTSIELYVDEQLLNSYQLNAVETVNLLNFDVYGRKMLVAEATLKEIEDLYKSKAIEVEHVTIDTFQISNKEQLATATTLYEEYISEDRLKYNFYSSYQQSLQFTGLLIFIAAFLGLAFLASTGSILYFKQMTEAEQEKQYYKTLRQLGFDVNMIMSGIVKKQLIVFLLPLTIGILHAIFAIRAASFMFITDNTVPTIISFIAYTLVYFIFAILTLSYYRKIVKHAMH